MINSYNLAKSIGVDHYLIVRLINRYICNKKNSHRKNIHYHFRKKEILSDRGKCINSYDITNQGLKEIINSISKMKKISGEF